MRQIQKTIEEFLDRDAVLATVSVDATVADAVAVMRDKQSSCVLAVEAGRVAGIFTGRDFLNRVATLGRPPTEVALRHVMTPDPDSLRPGDSVTYAINLMVEGGFRNIPIVADGKPIAILTVKQMTEHLAEVFAGTELDDDEASITEWDDIGGG